MKTHPRPSGAAGTRLSALVDEAFAGRWLYAAAHGADWPDPTEAGPLPPALWDRALGDVARDILARPSRQFRARLCELTWRLGDGQGEAPRLLSALVEIIHAGSLIVDDIEDGSTERRGAPAAHVEHGLPRALNTGNWMYFWALRLVEELEVDAPVRERLYREIVSAMHDCHLGQGLDLSIAVGRLPQAAVYRVVATSTMLKTGALMALAARLGAVVARAPAANEAALARFGRRLGLGLQMMDDFGNLTGGSEGNAAKAFEDLRNGRPTWPWALAARTLDPAAFAELQARARRVTNEVDDGARSLAAELRMATGRAGRRQAADYLEAALNDLRGALGPRPELAFVAAEIKRLEESYG